MSIFKTACRVLFGHVSYIFIYVVLLGLMGVFVAAGSSVGVTSDTFEQGRASVAVIDRDGSELSRSLAPAMSDYADVVDVADDERALQDAVAQKRVHCLFIVPEGFGAAFEQAASAGGELPRVQTVTSSDGTGGFEAESQLRMYLSCVAARMALSTQDASAGQNGESVAGAANSAGVVSAGASASAASPGLGVDLGLGSGPGSGLGSGPGSGPGSAPGSGLGSGSASPSSASVGLEQVLDAARDDMAHTAQASYYVEEGEALPLPDNYLLYNRWSVYPVTCAVGVLIAVMMAGFNKPDLRRRNLSAPVSSLKLSFGLAAASVVAMLVTWAWISAQGVIAFGGSLEGVETWRIALCMVDLLAFSLFAMALGFLFSQMGATELAANAASNIVGLVLSFLGGAWIDARLMGPTLEAVGYFMPAYWHGQALVAIARAGSFSAEALAPALGCIGMVLLFAMALFAVALVVGRVRLGSAGAKG